MNTVSFTGCSEATEAEYGAAIRRVLAGLELEPEAVYTGGAHGVDTIAYYAAQERWPEARHVVLAPQGCRHNQRLTALAGNVEWINGGYMKRNDALVARGGTLLAFPPTAQEVLRGKGGGTWSTVRRGRKAGRGVRIYPLSEIGGG